MEANERKKVYSNPDSLKRNKKDRMSCFACKNQTFILTRCSDFPFFDVMCSKCGSMYIL